jgi:branched-chain amino acid transport system ATP-binding protein
MLNIRNVSVAYDNVVALQDVSLVVHGGEISAIVGPNGAGKSTLLKAISGTVELRSGTIDMAGRDLRSVDPADRPRLGIAHVPEGRQVFNELTVEENLILGATCLYEPARRKERFEAVFDLFPILSERHMQLAGTLSGGEQQMLAIGRGLMMDPVLMLLDEPSLGLAPAVVKDIFRVIQRLKSEFGLTVVLVEQRVLETIDSCDSCHVLAAGRFLASGPRQDVVASGAISRAYFGK